MRHLPSFVRLAIPSVVIVVLTVQLHSLPLLARGIALVVDTGPQP
jgi:hypothetical protein